MSRVYIGGENTSSCGYCHNEKKSSTSFGISALALTPQDYQCLCDRGFRRSGNYVYAINPERTCCPALTIRLDASKFSPDKEQKRLVRRLNQYLRGEIAFVQRSVKSSTPDDILGVSDATGTANMNETIPVPTDPIPLFLDEVVRRAASRVFQEAENAWLGTPLLVSRIKFSRGERVGGVFPSFTTPLAFNVRQKLCGAGEAPSLSIVADTLSEAVVKELNTDAIMVRATPSGHVNFYLPLGSVEVNGVVCGAPLPTPAPTKSPSPPAISPPTHPPHSWEVKVVPSSEYDPEAYALYCTYQKMVHHEKKIPTVSQYTSFLCDSPLLAVPWGSTVGMSSAAIPPPSNPLGSLGGSKVTHPLVSRILAQLDAAWERGEGACEGVPLMGTPLRVSDSDKTSPGPEAGEEEIGKAAGGISSCASEGGGSLSWLQGFPPHEDYVFPDLLNGPSNCLWQGYGTFHHKYYLDGKLVAVGVLDVLPNALSSVYVFYDPHVSKNTLPLGKITALREIQWVQAVCGRPVHAPPSIETAMQGSFSGSGGPQTGQLQTLSCASPRLRYYYLGYYIHSCIKMKYKAEYSPSDLLCPITKAAWVPFAEAKSALDREKCPILLVGEQLDTWRSNDRLREATLGLSLARAVLFIEPARYLGVKELRDGPAKVHIVECLKSWLSLAGPLAGGRCVVSLS